MRVELCLHKKEWAALFELERRDLLDVLGPIAVAIEHIGSTAIPQLAAKPILDLQVAVESLTAFDDSTGPARIESLKYTHRTDLQAMVPFRRFFARRGIRDFQDAQIHLVERDHPWWDRHLLFRDYLRESGDARGRYEELKLQLAEKEWAGIRAYTNAKTDLIIRLEEEAFVHFGLSESERVRIRAGRVE